ncbi:MAG TPA: maleylpyruvate isomerase family mycothiol-dependent enzyme [Streptosporangiaceae bacterium]|nr:maleylpyruvate isomerase family mycothiol-dependent enzyme [Streptosporangiaceae bacterium]
MELTPGPWIDALRHSHDTLRASVEPLDAPQVQRQSYASEWSIAQVLSHLGSGAQIFSLFLDAGLSGAEPPGRDTFPPIWEAWNARSPQAQAADGLTADRELVERFESLDADQRDHVRLQLFGMDLDITGLARMRLSEHAIHTWDVAVALDPAATVAADAVGLLIDTLDQVAGRTAKAEGTQLKLCVSTTSPERHVLLETGENLTLVAAEPDDSLPQLRLPAEAFVRLVYGRLDAMHTPAVETKQVDLDELRKIFPGF